MPHSKVGRTRPRRPSRAGSWFGYETRYRTSVCEAVSTLCAYTEKQIRERTNANVLYAGGVSVETKAILLMLLLNQNHVALFPLIFLSLCFFSLCFFFPLFPLSSSYDLSSFTLPPRARAHACTFEPPPCTLQVSSARIRDVAGSENGRHTYTVERDSCPQASLATDLPVPDSQVSWRNHNL